MYSLWLGPFNEKAQYDPTYAENCSFIIYFFPLYFIIHLMIYLFNSLFNYLFMRSFGPCAVTGFILTVATNASAANRKRRGLGLPLQWKPAPGIRRAVHQKLAEQTCRSPCFFLVIALFPLRETNIFSCYVLPSLNWAVLMVDAENNLNTTSN